MTRSIVRFTDFLSLLMGYLAGLLILAIVVMQVAEIILRNVFNVSMHFVWEYAAYFHISAIFLAAAYTLRTGGHIRITLLHQFFPRTFEIIGTALGLLISGFLSMALIQFAWNYGVTGRSSGTINDVALVYPAGVMAFGSAMLTLQLCIRLVQACLNRPVEIKWNASAAVE